MHTLCPVTGSRRTRSSVVVLLPTSVTVAIECYKTGKLEVTTRYTMTLAYCIKLPTKDYLMITHVQYSLFIVHQNYIKTHAIRCTINEDYCIIINPTIPGCN